MSSWWDAKRCIWSVTWPRPARVAVRLAELLQEARDDPLGHAPDDRILELVGLDHAGTTGDIQPDWMVSALIEEEAALIVG